MVSRKKGNREQGDHAQADAKPEIGGNRIPAMETSLYEVIELRAYELYQQRGDGEGDAMSDWLQAETEIMSELGLSNIRDTDAGVESKSTAAEGVNQSKRASG
jgi:hypothetical protein